MMSSKILCSCKIHSYNFETIKIEEGTIVKIIFDFGSFVILLIEDYSTESSNFNWRVEFKLLRDYYQK